MPRASPRSSSSASAAADFRAQRRVGTRGVDEIRRVRRDREESRARERRPEFRGFLRRALLADPAARVLDENLEDAAPGGDGAIDGLGRSAGNGMVSTEEQIA